MRFVVCGLSITSSWGNGHATTYRALLRELARRGHDVLFLERDVPWYAENRDLPKPPFCRTKLYKSLDELKRTFSGEIKEADAVVVGSYVPQGVEVGEWVTRTARGVTAFYDIDTPVTMAKLARHDYEYLSPELIPRYRLYLSFTGGPLLDLIERDYGSPAARVLYCSVDPEAYFPERQQKKWMMGYLGTYGADRQPALDRLLTEAARRRPANSFVVAGPLYPDHIAWPENVERIDHLPPSAHRRFYNSQRYTLNVTRADMVRAGYSPSVRLFEAAACGTPIISDYWEGLDTVLKIGKEILVARSTEKSLAYMNDLSDEERKQIGRAGRARVLAEHTSAHRAAQLEAYVEEAASKRKSRAAAPRAGIVAMGRRNGRETTITAPTRR